MLDSSKTNDWQPIGVTRDVTRDSSTAGYESDQSRGTESVIKGWAQKWWAVALRGLIAIAFGVGLLAWQGATLETVVLLFGILALSAGLVVAVVAMMDRTRPRWWILLLEGGLGAIVGLIALFWPGISGLWLLYLIVAWGMLNGLFQVMAALALRHDIVRQWWYAAFGLLTIAFGLLLLIVVGADLMVNLWLVALYAVFFGTLHILLAWRLWRWAKTPHGQPVT